MSKIKTHISRYIDTYIHNNTYIQMKIGLIRHDTHLIRYKIYIYTHTYIQMKSKITYTYKFEKFKLHKNEKIPN